MSVAAVAPDGNCVLRAALVALGLPAKDNDVSDLRHKVVQIMGLFPERFRVAILQGLRDHQGEEDDDARISKHMARAAEWGTFCGDPECQAIADALGATVIVHTIVATVPG